ncbi:MAG TPA: ATP-dependent DNA helicase [Burkholderiaceae bacterium]|nr:ATP-dependent DNA helicase [Burkholderiaceae bacterium]
MSTPSPWTAECTGAADSTQIALRRRELTAAFAADGALAGAIKGFRVRTSQREMALAVFETIARRTTLAAEAGTGTGKTMAYLVPAVLAGGKVLVAAGTKTLQDQIFDKDLPIVCRALGVRVDAAILKGRQNYVCRLRLGRTAAAGMLSSREDVQALQQIVRFVRESQTGDVSELERVTENASIWPAVTSTRDNCVGSECEHFEECFVFRARRRALAADLVIVNHHLLLADMALREEIDSVLLPNADVVIVDEAHHLARIAAEFFGERWSLQQITQLGADSLQLGLSFANDGAKWPDLARALDQGARAVRLALAQDGVDRRTRVAYDQFGSAQATFAAIAALDGSLTSLQEALDRNQGRSAELDLLLPQVVRVRRTMQVWHQCAPRIDEVAQLDTVRWVSTSAQGAQFHTTPLSCAEAFARVRGQREQAWIFTSATLTTAQQFAPFLQELGLSGSQALRWDSPFDFARQALLYLPALMPNPQSEDFAELVADAAWPVLRASRGRAFVLCSTLRAVPRVAARLQTLMAATQDFLPLMVQGEAHRRTMLGEFRRLGNAVLVGSVSFWEGIDVRGEALSVVVIDKLPFAPPDDPVVAARIQHMKAQGRNAFREYQLPQAITLLRQGVGRLIRDDTDRGVLMILDERLLSRSYGKTILASLPPFGRTRNEDDACAFIAGAQRDECNAPDLQPG